MSASDKKKLRREQNAAKMTEKQHQEQAEAKKLKNITTIFVVAIVAIMLLALGTLCYKTWVNNGFGLRLTTAAVVDGKKLNTPQMSYYYNDAINELYSEWASNGEDADVYMKSILGLDTSLPLNKQKNPETDQLWSDYFLTEALNDAKSDFALAKKAKSEGFKLPEDKQTELDTMLDNMKMYATMYGFPNANEYVAAIYGKGASLRSYRKYCERSYLADAYAEAHQESLVYDDAALRAYDKDKYNDYSTYHYTQLYLSYSYFQTGGTTNDDGTVTYSDAENDAARAAMQAAVDQLLTATNVEELETIAAGITVKEGASLTVNKDQRTLCTSLAASNADLATWMSDENRTEGEIGSIPVTAKTTNEAGEEVENTNGYYIVIFHELNDNTKPMSNVRHLLVKFEGGEEDEETGNMVYTDEEKAAAKEIAEGYLKTWKEGPATEESFIELVLAHSQDNGVTENEGLYEDINPDSNYVPNFLNWSIDPAREVGDTDVIETEYGYHVMYYSSHSELSYRDYMITEELRVEEQEAWVNSIVDAASGELKNTSKLGLDLVISPA